MISNGESKDQIKYMIMTKALTSAITELTLNLNYKFLRDVNYVESISYNNDALLGFQYKIPPGLMKTSRAIKYFICKDLMPI